MMFHTLRSKCWIVLTFVLACAAWRHVAAQQPASAPNEATDFTQPRVHNNFIIIVPEKLRDAVDEYYMYKKHNLPTDIYTLEYALNLTSGEDDAERLKRFIYIQWRVHKVGYVLLVGDVDVMPVRYMVLDRVTPAAFDYAFYASDLYYADIAKLDGAFEDWNAQKDGFHARYLGEVRGEKIKTDPINFDQVDYMPELAVGRWPVSTPEQARVIAQKTIAYEKSMLADQHVGARTAGLIACGGWVDGRGLFDKLATTLPKGWAVEKRYYKDDARDDHTAPPTSQEVVSLMNSGAGVIAHIGHGDNNSWNGCLSAADIAAMKNSDRLPIMISAGCSTAACTAQAPYEGYTDVDGAEHKGTNNGEVFASPPPPPACYQKGEHNATSLGEKLLRDTPNGAVAYIGCNTGGQPCALTLVEGFISAISHYDKPRVGECWVYAVRRYYEKEHLATIKPDDGWYPPSVFYQPMKYMLFGDPTLLIAGPKPSEGSQ